VNEAPECVGAHHSGRPEEKQKNSNGPQHGSSLSKKESRSGFRFPRPFWLIPRPFSFPRPCRWTNPARGVPPTRRGQDEAERRSRTTSTVTKRRHSWRRCNRRLPARREG
jgi:hypothetical protein